MGIEPPSNSPEKTASFAKGGAKSGALPTQLDTLAAALLKLAPEDRARLAAMLLDGQPPGGPETR
jgi:hypothetical protein